MENKAEEISGKSGISGNPGIQRIPGYPANPGSPGNRRFCQICWKSLIARNARYPFASAEFPHEKLSPPEASPAKNSPRQTLFPPKTFPAQQSSRQQSIPGDLLLEAGFWGSRVSSKSVISGDSRDPGISWISSTSGIPWKSRICKRCQKSWIRKICQISFCIERSP